MAKMPRTFVTSDWHLYHKRIVESCDRPNGFEHIIIENHRRVLRPQDTLINLGDVIFYRHYALKSILDSIPGTKILLRGNHDYKTFGWYMRNGFHYAADLIVVGGVAFSHKPLRVLPDGCTLNIHGHLHRDKYDKEDWHRLIAMEDSYMPVLLDHLKMAI